MSSYINDWWPGIQGSFHSLAALPFPILHIQPWFNSFLASQIPRHSKDGLLPRLAFKKTSLGKYFALNTLWINEFVSCMILHPCLANKVKLNTHKSLKLSPHFLFWSHIFCQLIQWILLLSFLCPYQNFVIMTSNSEHIPVGKRKQLIEYVEIEMVTALIRISLPPCESKFSFQFWSFCHTFCFISVKAFVLDLSTAGGNPKYFSYYWTPFTPHNYSNSFFLSIEIFPLKIIAVFSLLIFWPEACSYLANSAWIFIFSLTSASQKITISSAKSRWLIKGALMQILILEISCLKVASFDWISLFFPPLFFFLLFFLSFSLLSCGLSLPSPTLSLSSLPRASVLQPPAPPPAVCGPHRRCRSTPQLPSTIPLQFQATPCRHLPPRAVRSCGASSHIPQPSGHHFFVTSSLAL